MIESSEGPVAIVSFLLKGKWGGTYYWHRGHSPIMEIVKGFERFLVTDFSITNDFHLKIPEEEIKQSLVGGENIVICFDLHESYYYSSCLAPNRLRSYGAGLVIGIKHKELSDREKLKTPLPGSEEFDAYITWKGTE
ncbi:hypothetical protein IKF04_03205 [Candidatus Saccharibacteria bacterium]|nr:hypothetical protein [Candidatus Saccharibacteria bacterium]